MSSVSTSVVGLRMTVYGLQTFPVPPAYAAQIGVVYSDALDLTYARTIGLRYIVVPLTTEDLFDGCHLKPAALTTLIGTITRAHTAGLKIVLSLSGALTCSNTLDAAWSRIHTGLASIPGDITYDLYPSSGVDTVETWVPLLQDTINLLRMQGCKRFLRVHGLADDAAKLWDVQNKRLHLTDPEQSVVYVSTASSGDDVSPFDAWLDRFGYRGSLSLRGTFSLADLDAFLTQALSRGLTVTLADLPSPDAYNRVPRDAYPIAALNDPLGYHPLPYFVYPGAVAGTFVVEYRGRLYSDVHVALVASNPAATFSTNMVTLAPGYNPAVTFSVSLPANSSTRLSFTNDGGLTDPVGLGYSTHADANVLPTHGLYGVQQLDPNYFGSMLTLTRTADGEQRTFSATPLGWIDVPAIYAWTSGADPLVDVLYDQTGAGHDLHAPADVLHRPMLTRVNGLPEIVFGGTSYLKGDWVLGTSKSFSLVMRGTHVSGHHAVAFRTTSAYASLLAEDGFVLTTVKPFRAQLRPVATEALYHAAYTPSSPTGKTAYTNGIQVARAPTGAPDAALSEDGLLLVGGIPDRNEFWKGSLQALVVLDASSAPADIHLPTTAGAPVYVDKTPTKALPFLSSTYLQPLHYRGATCSGSEFYADIPQVVGGSQYTYPSTQTLEYLAEPGVKLIRLPVLAKRLQPQPLGILDPIEVARIHSVVVKAAQQAQYVVIDVHDFGLFHGQTLDDNCGCHLPGFLDLWKRIASAWRMWPNVIFELSNTATAATPAGWRHVMDRASYAIRSTGASQLILVPGTAYSVAAEWSSSGNADAMATFTDANHAISVRQFLDNASGTSMACELNPEQRLVGITSWARTTGHRLFLSEFGTPFEPETCSPALQGFFDHMRGNSDVWLGYAYWAYSTAQYPYTLHNVPGDLHRPQMSSLLEDIFLTSAVLDPDAAVAVRRILFNDSLLLAGDRYVEILGPMALLQDLSYIWLDSDKVFYEPGPQ